MHSEPGERGFLCEGQAAAEIRAREVTEPKVTAGLLWRPQLGSGPPPQDCSLKTEYVMGRGRRDAGEGELSLSRTGFPWGSGAGKEEAPGKGW